MFFILFIKIGCQKFAKNYFECYYQVEECFVEWSSNGKIPYFEIIYLSRLKNLTKWGILEETQWNPMRYMACLEPIGFTDVKVFGYFIPDNSNFEDRLY